MGLKWMQAVLTAIGVVALSGVAAHAQTGADSQAQANSAGRAKAGVSTAQLDFGASFYEALNSSSTGDGVQQVTTNAAGGMIEGRYIDSPLVGFEITYAYNPENQTLSPTATNCGYECQNPTTPLKVKANEVGLDWVFSKKFGDLRPFAVGGLGFFISSPGKSTYEVNTVVRPAYIGGGGVDWGVLPRFGIRVQFRDNVYKAPDLSPSFFSTGVFTHTMEPMAGFYFHL